MNTAEWRGSKGTLGWGWQVVPCGHRKMCSFVWDVPGARLSCRGLLLLLVWSQFLCGWRLQFTAVLT